MKVLRIITQLIPAVRELVRATSRQSPGGKRITPEEWRVILDTFLAAARDVVQRELGPQVA